MSNKTRKGIRPAYLAAMLGVVAMLAVLAALTLPSSAQAQDNPFAPAAPTGVTAAAATDGSQVTVNWTAGARSTGYEVERKVGSGAWAGISPAHAGTTASYMDSSVSAGMTYTYRVRGTNAFGTSAWVESNAVALPDDGTGNGNGMMGDRMHASMPVMFAAEGLDNTARLSWRQPKLRDPGASVIGYRINRDAWKPDTPIDMYGDGTIDLLNLASVLAADHTDRGLAYSTAYIYQVRAIVEYNLAYWWDNLDCAMMNAVVDPRAGEPTVASGAYCHMYKDLSKEAKPVVHRAYNLQDGKYPVAMVDTWWNALGCMDMNDAVSPMAGEPPVGSDDPNHDPRSAYCYMYDDLSPAAVTVVKRAHYNSYHRYAFGMQSAKRTVMTGDSGGLLNSLLAPPSAPMNVEAEASCDDKITVTWEPPADLGKVPAEFPGCATCRNQTPIHHGGTNSGIEVQPGTAEITSYMVERKVGNGAWMTAASNLPATARSWTDDDEDLAYGMTYHYRVRATNNANLTGPAAMVTKMLVEPAEPMRPTSLVVNLETDQEGNPAFELQWDPPSDMMNDDGEYLWRTMADFEAGKEAGHYQSGNLEYTIQRQVGNGDWVTIREQPHQYSRDGLRTVLTQEYVHTPDDIDDIRGEVVRYRVSALVNDCNPSDWNQADEVEVPPATAPGMPTALMATAMGQHQIDLSWTEPDDGGSPITGYTFEYSTDGGNTWSDPADTDTMTSHSHTGLMPGTTYTYRVTAMNAEGSSMASETKSATTAAAPALGAPAITAASSTAAGSATITLTPGSNATKHFVWAFRVGGTSNATDGKWSGQAAGNATSVTISGLTSGESYWFIAIAGRGDGAATQWSNWSGWTAATPIQ